MKVISFQRVRQLPLWQPLTARDFRLLWMGQGVSLFGDQFYMVALPWLTLKLTGSGLALGTVLMAAGAVRATFQLVGGALGDRFSHRALMLGSNLIRAAVTAALTAVVMAGVTQLWHLYILSVIFGLVDAFFLPAYMAISPTLVTSEQLQASNAWLRVTARFMALIGPAAAGVVITTLGLGAAFALDTASFVFAAVMIWLIKEQIRARSSAEEKEQKQTGSEKESAGLKGLMKSIGVGLRYAWGDPLIRALLFFIGVIEFSFVGPFSVGLAAMAKTRFESEGGAVALGWMLSAFGAGMLAGMLVAGSMKVPRRRGTLVICVTFLLGIGLTLVGFATRVVWAGISLGFAGLGAGIANIVILAWLQARTERVMLGRVMGLLMFGAAVLEPLSLALAGVMADRNLTALFVGSGAIVLVTSAASLRSHALRTSD